MPIPEGEPFESFMAACRVATILPDGPYYVLRDEMRVEKDGEPAEPLFLAYPESSLSFQAVLSKTKAHLDQIGCITNEQIAASALALAVTTRPLQSPAVTHTNDFISRIHQAQLMQSIVLPGRPRPDYEVSLGTYRIKTFTSERIRYWAERCRSAYPFDLRSLDGWASLEREPFEVQLIDCQLSDWWRGSNRNTQDVEALLDCYYTAVGQAAADMISRHVKTDVLVLESAALFWIDIEELLNQLFMQIVTFFTWRHDRGHDRRFAGWATYSRQSGLHSNFPPSELLQECRRWLHSELNFQEFSTDRQLDQTIKTYCRFLQRAHGHRLSGRFDEAFLHFAIALDLLLGTEQQISEFVSSRAAVLVHRQFGNALDQQTKAVKDLYNTRSRYVHKGQSVGSADLVSIEKVTTEILWTLLATSGRGEIRDREEWMRRLTFIHAALQAARQVEEADFAAIGIPPPGRYRAPPNRVQG